MTGPTDTIRTFWETVLAGNRTSETAISAIPHGDQNQAGSTGGIAPWDGADSAETWRTYDVSFED